MHRKIFKLNRYLLLPALLSTVFLSTVLLCACEQAAKQYHYSIFTFGTLIDVTLYDVDRQQAENAFQLLQKDFDGYHQQWSPWTDGALAGINEQLADASTDEKTAITLPAHLLAIIETSMRLSEQSNNYYNPTIGKLINLWQFHRHQESGIKPPEHEQIQALVKHNPQMSDLFLDDKNQLHSSNAAVALNFGAFAKGYAITLSIERLKKLGIENAIINAGGDLSVIGQHGKRSWNIGIRHPRSEQVLASVELKSGESVFTSGDYERLYQYQGQRYHHILDPKTGYPTQDAQSVTVIHTDAGLADAAATAIFVAGSKHWQTTAKNMGLDYVLLVDSSGDIHITAAMLERIKFVDKSSTSDIFISEEL